MRDLRYAFVDVEVGLNDHRLHDIGAIRHDGAIWHGRSREALLDFLADVDFVCGHNIVHHDAEYLFADMPLRWALVDTLYLSPLMFPERPYHRLLKDDKLVSDQINNPVNDCEKARDLLWDEVAAWDALPAAKREILAALVAGQKEFDGFLRMVGAVPCSDGLADRVRRLYEGRICQHADIESLAEQMPCELAYALALVDTTDHRSVTPGWVLHTYPDVERVVAVLRHTRCSQGCPYCDRQLGLHRNLKTFFGYDEFRTYEGEPLQEQAARAAVSGRSLLAIFPTGGGKSLTFQLPALMAGRAVHGLTVVISPLQSLMKDQVDNLAERGIAEAVTINGLLDPITRSSAIKQVAEGNASLLYISPETLRSKTIELILLARNVVRFVIDEAHCFSSWGQDFRVDYLYIGKFIKMYQDLKHCSRPIPVSCFTATAKQKVVQDIRDYFKRMLHLDLDLFSSSATRTNLRYSVIHADTDDEKYALLRSLVVEYHCPTIVYVSRTKRTQELAAKLTRDGQKALPFNGKMEADEKVAHQDAFMSGRVRIIVATSAFGMGVDKSDVGLVVHYDISDSLENYVQEAGRAGRDPHLSAQCYVLYSDGDLDKHFVLLNQTKLSLSEINQVWRAVARSTKQRPRVCCSALEIAREAGWDDSVNDIETRVRTALAALEEGGYIVRGNNVPHVYATDITVRNVDEARQRITESVLFEAGEVEKAVRIIRSLISKKYVAKGQGDHPEARVDYLADVLGLTKREVVSVVERMRQEGILADTLDLRAYLSEGGESKKKLEATLQLMLKLERFIIDQLPEGLWRISSKQLNELAIAHGIAASSEKRLRTLIHFLMLKGYVRKQEDAAHNMEICHLTDKGTLLARHERRMDICLFAIGWLEQLAGQQGDGAQVGKAVPFSMVGLLQALKKGTQTLFGSLADVQLDEVEEALLYLTKIGVLKLEGGFMVLYQSMEIHRTKDGKLGFKKSDYRMLSEFYKQKMQQVHIVGEYANLMVRDYDAALQYVKDYFQMDYKQFIVKYFKGERLQDIERNITPQQHQKLFGQLSARQMEIIADKESHCIVVAAGPGSGKTRLLVHKLASLLSLEDVKHEQLLMLTFSRAAATEFKERLIALIGNAAHFVEIKTFHSYCFDLLGRMGNLEDVHGVVGRAAEMIGQGEVEPSRIAKAVLVIDEAQDMSSEEYALVHALMARNEEMRVVAVGDDDQNIFAFRGSCSDYMFQLAQEHGGRMVEMTDNYRSSHHVVAFANAFVQAIARRMKSTPIVAMCDEEGRVELTRHATACMYRPVVDDLLRHGRGGTVCVLTQTNEEAVTMVALLRREGITAQLVQSMDSYRFYNLAEVRHFIRQLEKGATTPLIPDWLWHQAKESLQQVFARSLNLPYVCRCIQLFEQTNKTKYFSDFRDFVFESSMEDFCEIGRKAVVVSTIHKAKGREFDDVYLLVADNGSFAKDDELLRRLYVGMTRARNRLFIHTNADYIRPVAADSYDIDPHRYGLPEEIVLQPSHKDLYLGFFKDIKRKVLRLQAGDALEYGVEVLCDAATHQPVARLSKDMVAKLRGWHEKGYGVAAASVRCIVAWKPKEAASQTPETAVLLPELVLRRLSPEGA